MTLESQVINMTIKQVHLEKNKDIFLTDTSKEKGDITMRKG